MGGSAAQAPTSPDELPPGSVPPPPESVPPEEVRASDAERDQAIGELREQFAAGRLSHDTFLFRMNAALAARRRAELPPLLADLPARRRPRGWLQRGWLPARRLTRAWLAGRVFRPAPATPAAPATPVALSFPRGAKTRFSIGRSRDCDLTIEDLTVSRVHARLDRTSEGWLLTDLSSTNGTKLNGWRVDGQVAVRAGDLVRFGDTEYRLAGTDEV